MFSSKILPFNLSIGCCPCQERKRQKSELGVRLSTCDVAIKQKLSPRPPEWESGSGSAQAGAQSTSGHQGKNANTRIKIYRDVLDRCQEYQSAKSRYWKIQSLEVSTDNPHTLREERLEVMTYVASRAYRAARREAEELEDVEVGVTCHVSRVTCQDDCDICIRVVMLQSCARSPPASTATAVSTPPPRGRW